jgi:hypothetical protein
MIRTPFPPLIPFDHPSNLANEDGTLKGGAMIFDPGHPQMPDPEEPGYTPASIEELKAAIEELKVKLGEIQITMVAVSERLIEISLALAIPHVTTPPTLRRSR